MTAGAPRWIEPAEIRAATDQRVLAHGVTWANYRLMRELFDGPGIRLSYLEGTLEIMSPSSRHEFLKTRSRRVSWRLGGGM